MALSRIITRISGEEVKVFSYRGAGRGRHALNGVVLTTRRELVSDLTKAENRKKLGLVDKKSPPGTT